MPLINTLKLSQELNKVFSKEQTEILVKMFRDFSEDLITSKFATLVTKDEFKDLKLIVEELAEAQKRTEQRVEELAEAQKRTEQKVEELAEAQKRTEEELRALSRGIKELRTEVGRLSDSIGYGLEDLGKVILPAYIEKKYGISEVEFTRKFIKVNQEEIEINLYSEGKRNGVPIVLLGESRSRIYSNDVNKFLNNLKKLEPFLEKEIFRFMFGYVIHPSAEKIALEKNIELIATYKLTR